MTEHPQTRFRGVDIDAMMVPLIRALWDRGIRTVASCQEWSVMGGAAYVSFVDEDSYQTFREIVESVSTVVVNAVPDADLIELLRDPDYVETAADRGGCWSVGFPPGDISVVTRASRVA